MMCIKDDPLVDGGDDALAGRLVMRHPAFRSTSPAPFSAHRAVSPMRAMNACRGSGAKYDHARVGMVIALPRISDRSTAGMLSVVLPTHRTTK